MLELENITQTDIWEKEFIKRKKRLKTFILFENNQPITNAESKKKHRKDREYLQS